VAALAVIGCQLGGDGDEAPWLPSSADVDADADGDGDTDHDTLAGQDHDTSFTGDKPEPCWETQGLGGGTTCIDGDADADFDEPEPDFEPPDGDTDSDDECDTENETVLYLSADDSNSMAGPIVARATINEGGFVFRALRTYEFLNYYTFDYVVANPGTVRVTAQLDQHSDGESYDLQIGVRAPNQNNDARRPVNLVLSLDTSGSMSGQPIELVRECCVALAGSLRDGDVISMVSWSTTQAILLDSLAVDGPDDPSLLDACAELESGGGTDLHSGLVTAYQLAEANFEPTRINRVILMSDGGANVGITDEELIAAYAEEAENEPIYLMGVGISEASGYNDELMDTVTDKGKGSYVFVDSVEEAQRMFGERFIANVEVAARDVRVEVDLPPTFEMIAFHGEEYSEDPDEVEPQHLAPNDAMIFHQVVGSCEPSAVSEDDAIRVAAEWLNPFTLETNADVLETTLGELLAEDKQMLVKGNAVVAYAETLKKLKDLPCAACLDRIDETVDLIEQASADLGGDDELDEIAELLLTYRAVFEP
jgi:Ca-activated chloride channel family protein